MVKRVWGGHLFQMIREDHTVRIVVRVMSLCLLAGLLLLDGSQLMVRAGSGVKKICFVYQQLETEFWIAGHSVIVHTLKSHGFQVIEYDAHKDANVQLQQVKACIDQKVDGIIIIPEDGDSAISIIGEANAANIPIGVFNRPPSDNNPNPALVVVANNEAIAQQAVQFMALQAMKLHHQVHPLILVGDLGDPNSIGRKEGFDTVIARYPALFAEPVYVNTRWDPDLTRQNLQAAMQAHPDVDFIFTSSDFLYPQIQAVLEPLGKWKPISDPGHIILGGLDGDSRACRLMKSGYVDATGVQNLFSEADAMTHAFIKAINTRQGRLNQTIQDSGFALTQDNLSMRAQDMWGCVLPLPANGV